MAKTKTMEGEVFFEGLELFGSEGSEKVMYPTPTTHEIEHPNAEVTEDGRRAAKNGGEDHSFGLADAVKQTWRTPKSRCTADSSYNDGFRDGGVPLRPSGNKVELTLENQVLIREEPVEKKGNWRTPAARCGGEQSAEYHKQMVEGNLIRPTTGTVIQMRLDDQVQNTGFYPEYANPTGEKEEKVGQLNPDWVEWLMGWPVGWTSLKPLALEKFEEWKRSVLDGTYWDNDPAEYPKDDPRYIPRLTFERDFRTNRLEAIGNGQVPQCIYFAEGLMAEEV